MSMMEYSSDKTSLDNKNEKNNKITDIKNKKDNDIKNKTLPWYQNRNIFLSHF